LLFVHYCKAFASALLCSALLCCYAIIGYEKLVVGGIKVIQSSS
jgi:hypothetical protein